MRRDGEFADGGGVAQAEIEPLRADRRNHMRGFAHQRDALVSEASGGDDAEWKQPAARLDLDLAQDRMRRAFDLGSEGRVVERRDLVRMNRIEHPDQARTRSRQRHQSEWPTRGMEFGRCVAVRTRMLKGYRESDLRVVAFVDADAGGVA